MGPLRRRSFICCQACVFHISAWRPTPMTVTSFSSFACWRRLLVRRRLHGGGVQKALHVTGFHHAFFGQKCGNALPFVFRKRHQTVVQPAGDDESAAHGLAEFGREIEPPLVVDGIAVLADQHFQPPPSRHMGEFPHFYPLCPTSVSIIRGAPVKINPFSVKVFAVEPFLTVSKHVSGRIFFGNRSVSPHGRAKDTLAGVLSACKRPNAKKAGT